MFQVGQVSWRLEFWLSYRSQHAVQHAIFCVMRMLSHMMFVLMSAVPCLKHAEEIQLTEQMQCSG